MLFGFQFDYRFRVNMINASIKVNKIVDMCVYVDHSPSIAYKLTHPGIKIDNRKIWFYLLRFYHIHFIYRKLTSIQQQK